MHLFADHKEELDWSTLRTLGIWRIITQSGDDPRFKPVRVPLPHGERRRPSDTEPLIATDDIAPTAPTTLRARVVHHRPPDRALGHSTGPQPPDDLGDRTRQVRLLIRDRDIKFTDKSASYTFAPCLERRPP